MWPEDADKNFKSNLVFKKSNPDDNKHYDHFVKWVKKLSGANNDSLETKAHNLFKSLRKFEKVFAKYIIQERNNYITKEKFGTRDKYADQARSLLESFVWDRPGTLNHQVDVLSFITHLIQHL